jgi:hypothetical protein
MPGKYALYSIFVTLLIVVADPRAVIAQSLEEIKNARMTTAELNTTFPGKRFLGTLYRWHIQMSIDFHKDGTMKGAMDISDAFLQDDVGRWEIKNDMLCRHWKKYGNGVYGCFYIVKEGEDYKWFDESARILIHGKIAEY